MHWEHSSLTDMKDPDLLWPSCVYIALTIKLYQLAVCLFLEDSGRLFIFRSQILMVFSYSLQQNSKLLKIVSHARMVLIAKSIVLSSKTRKI